MQTSKPFLFQFYVKLCRCAITCETLVILSVYNTGAGISKDDQKRIFDCYSVFNNVEEGQNDEQTSRNGIGMAICYNITKELGGDVRIESEVSKYARFIVTLPSQQLPEGAPQDQEPINRSNMAFWKSLKMASTAENKKIYQSLNI